MKQERIQNPSSVERAVIETKISAAYHETAKSNIDLAPLEACRKKLDANGYRAWSRSDLGN
jgi:hypothetical protein